MPGGASRQKPGWAGGRAGGPRASPVQPLWFRSGTSAQFTSFPSLSGFKGGFVRCQVFRNMPVTPDSRGESLGKRETLERWGLDQTLKGQREDAEPLSHGSRVGVISDGLAESPARQGAHCAAERSRRGWRTTCVDTFFFFFFSVACLLFGV